MLQNIYVFMYEAARSAGEQSEPAERLKKSERSERK